MAVPLPRLAIVTADGQERLVEGSLASIIEVLLQEQALIEICGDKLHIEIDCAGGRVRADIGKRSIELHRVA